MEYLVVTLNWICSLIAAAALSWLVLSPRIDEGIGVKVGVVLMIFGLLGNAAVTLTGASVWHATWNAGLLLRGGIVVVCVALWWRHRRA